MNIYKSEEMFQKGLNYYFGLNEVKQDPRKSLAYFLEADKQEHIESSYYLGLLYLNYEPYIQRNHKKVIEYFKKSSENGFAAGQLNLGKCYTFGYGTNIDYSEAIIYYEKAKEQFNVEAIDILCEFYRFGIGTEINLDKAYEYNELCKVLSNNMLNMDRYNIRSLGIKKDKAQKYWTQQPIT